MWALSSPASSAIASCENPFLSRRWRIRFPNSMHSLRFFGMATFCPPLLRSSTAKWTTAERPLNPLQLFYLRDTLRTSVRSSSGSKEMLARRIRMRRLNSHHAFCAACAIVRKGKKATVWMTPQFADEKLFYVCGDPNCEARLVVLNVQSLRLPSV